MPKGVTSIDVFCVGGGQGGGASSTYQVYFYNDNGSLVSRSIAYSGSGGSAGFTTTQKAVSVTPGQSIAVTIGAGGTNSVYSEGLANGSNTTVIANGNSVIGYAFKYGESPTRYVFNGYFSSRTYICGGGAPGGSVCWEFGGTYGWSWFVYSGYDDYTKYSYMLFDSIPPGYNGGDSYSKVMYCGSVYGKDPYSTMYGQGTTTRYFGESNGTLYATGGYGGSLLDDASYATNTTDNLYTSKAISTYIHKNYGFNTGNGGCGSSPILAPTYSYINEYSSAWRSALKASYMTYVYYYGNNGYSFSGYVENGSSGIAIIRWGKK